MARSTRPLTRITLPRTARAHSTRRTTVWRTNTVLSLTALTVALSYVFLINDVSTKGYEIQSLKRNSATVNEELMKAKRQAASDQSIRSIADRLNNHSFVPEGAVEYAHPGSPVALGSATQ